MGLEEVAREAAAQARTRVVETEEEARMAARVVAARVVVGLRWRRWWW